MADNKKYYYLKLKENFFDTDEMIVLESMPDGYLYSNILLKLYLRSLKYDGRLMFNERIPFNSTMLAQVTRHSVGVVEKAMQVLQELSLIEILDNGAIYMLDIQNFIGKSTTEADRVRNYRRKIDSEKSGVQIPYKCTPEIEIEKEIKKEKDIEEEGEEVSIFLSSYENKFNSFFGRKPNNSHLTAIKNLYCSGSKPCSLFFDVLENVKYKKINKLEPYIYKTIQNFNQSETKKISQIDKNKPLEPWELEWEEKMKKRIEFIDDMSDIK